jgi:trimeric autotransporter adhesin
MVVQHRSKTFTANSITLDGSGGFYAADSTQNRAYRITADGTLRLYAATSAGFSGDGGPATLAQLNAPLGMAIDSGGNLYIADRSTQQSNRCRGRRLRELYLADAGNNRVPKVTPAGLISTIAGNGSRGFSGDGGPATAATQYASRR